MSPVVSLTNWRSALLDLPKSKSTTVGVRCKGDKRVCMSVRICMEKVLRGDNGWEVSERGTEGEKENRGRVTLNS